MMMGDTNDLTKMEKGKLIKIINSLRQEVNSLNETFKKVTILRLYHLGRSHNMHLQYGRKDTVEITGIPTNFVDTALEDEVIEIFKDAKSK